MTGSIERSKDPIAGWVVLIWIAVSLLAVILLVPRVPLIGVPVLFLVLIAIKGFLVLSPNEGCVLTFFGPYVGTVRKSGFFWTNPFYSKQLISLRARNLEGARLKVNDKRGNPIEIAVVIVWRVDNAAAAIFDVENFENFVRIQSESAVRHLASSYAYDHGDDSAQQEITLRESADAISHALLEELRERCNKAGVAVDEARITHLAYAPEIAGVMLRRQQAEAVIAARQKIVHGAVSMVKMALSELKEANVVEFTPERKADMVTNLLVVLCGEQEVQPVVTAGSR